MDSWDVGMSTENVVHAKSLTNGEFTSHSALLILRLITLILLVALMTYHIRSLRVFRWEHSVSGGVLVTYVMAVVGLTLTAGLHHGGGKAFQAYICATGSLLLLLNAGMIYRRWRLAGDLTLVVADLLGALGVPLRRQVLIKVVLSAAAATALFIDLSVVAILMSK